MNQDQLEDLAGEPGVVGLSAQSSSSPGFTETLGRE